MRISYAITVCNEFIEIQRLVHFLLKHKRIQDNIVILYDEANGDPEIEAFLRSHSLNKEFVWHKGKFEKHFADWKNKLTSLCKGDYIFQIDADEIPSEDLIQNLPEILELNPEMDIFLVPRVNTVEGLTRSHIDKWRWFVDDNGWINYPDYQMRICTNKPEITYINKVHERLTGWKTIANLPSGYDLIHPKTIDRQEKQNNFYNTL
jgi:hypothetical protein